MNTMLINGVKAVIAYDADIEMFRGEFLGLNGGADFYAADVKGLRREGKISLGVFLDACAEDGVEPYTGLAYPQSLLIHVFLKPCKPCH